MKKALPLLVFTGFVTAAPPAPVEARKAPVLTVGALKFRDLNKNGALDPYEDWRQPVRARAADLVSRMDVAEKAGLMVHASVMGFTGPNGVVLDAAPAQRGGTGFGGLDRPAPSELILKRNVRWILTRPQGDTPENLARWANGVQEIAEGSRLGIPIVISSDPRHTPSRRPGPFSGASNLSAWPEQIGFGAIADPAVVREFGRIANKEYRAVGIRVALHPMADVATEPRWPRIPGTFGEDPKLAGELVKAYVEGFQGKQLGPESVLTVTKHWPGNGPVKDGFDPHNAYGKNQVYPGRNFDYHLLPFKKALEAGTGAIMPAYSIPVGFDRVGMAFSKNMIAELLRKKHRFDGLIITDWLISRMMVWGVEDLSIQERQRLVIEAGCDQLGGENDPGHILALVKSGAIQESRLDESVRRVLKPMFQMGLFENPYVDPERARAVVANARFTAAGEAAQRRSIVLLKNEGVLPLAGGAKLYIEGIRKEAAAKYGSLVDDPKGADVALIQVNAPYQVMKGGTFPMGYHEGDLAYAGAENAKELEAIRRAAALGKPTVVLMYMDRPAILSEFIGEVPAVLVHFNSSDEALLDVVFGRAAPGGKLPFNLPRDMESVKRQNPDTAHDIANPLFRFGFGLTYAARQSH